MYAKVIVVCANTERTERAFHGYPHHPQKVHGIDTLHEMWRVINHVEMTQDAGLIMDTIIVCNGEGAYKWWMDKDGVETKNGVYKVFQRPNYGGSFAGYNYAFRNTDYWGYLFTEEDIIVFGDNYYKRIVERFKEEKDAGFLCLIDASLGRLYPIHCHGGVGFTTREQMNKVVDKNGDLPFPKMDGWDQRRAVREGEAPFTNCYLQNGMKLFRMKEHKTEWCWENFAKSYYLLKKSDYNKLDLWYDNFRR